MKLNLTNESIQFAQRIANLPLEWNKDNPLIVEIRKEYEWVVKYPNQRVANPAKLKRELTFFDNTFNYFRGNYEFIVKTFKDIVSNNFHHDKKFVRNAILYGIIELTDSEVDAIIQEHKKNFKE